MNKVRLVLEMLPSCCCCDEVGPQLVLLLALFLARPGGFHMAVQGFGVDLTIHRGETLVFKFNNMKTKRMWMNASNGMLVIVVVTSNLAHIIPKKSTQLPS